MGPDNKIAARHEDGSDILLNRQHLRVETADQPAVAKTGQIPSADRENPKQW
jgi:hypothetical protein